VPDPIPAEWLEHELNYALALGLVRSWSMHRGGGGYRRYQVTLADDRAVLWTAATVEAFTIGVRISREAMDVA
jgi:hypothetical protein